jgi:hypothetical protein
LWSAAMVAPGVIARKRTAHRGGAETGRKAKKVLPRIGADKRGSERKISRESTRKNTNESGSHAGVTQRKSFKSGVRAEVPPGARTRDLKHRENSLNRHGRDQHSRGPSTPSQSRCSLGVRRDDSGTGHGMGVAHGNASVADHTEGDIAGHSSVSPRLCGEIETQTTKDTKEHEAKQELNACFSTQLHRDTQDREANQTNIMKDRP